MPPANHYHKPNPPTAKDSAIKKQSRKKGRNCKAMRKTSLIKNKRDR